MDQCTLLEQRLADTGGVCIRQTRNHNPPIYASCVWYMHMPADYAVNFLTSEGSMHTHATMFTDRGDG